MSAERLPLLKAAYVVARRDFVAILFSRAFFFFLLGPLFPLAVGALAGGIGQRVDSATASPQIGIAMQAADVDAMLAAQQRLQAELGTGDPEDGRAATARAGRELRCRARCSTARRQLRRGADRHARRARADRAARAAAMRGAGRSR